MIETRHTHELPLEAIEIVQPAEVQAAKLQSLIDSIRENGLISPISVNEAHQLLAGFHRFKAFEALARENPTRFARIPVRVLNASELLQLETTEKLFNPALTVLEKAAAFKAYFDTLKYGEERHKTTEIFRTLDISRRTFFNLRAIAEGLSPEVQDRIQALGGELASSSAQLLALAKYEPAEQLQLLEHMQQGQLPTIFDAIRTQPKVPEDSSGRKGRQKILKSPSLKLERDLRRELLELSRRTRQGQNELFNEIFATGLEIVQRKYSS